MKIAELISKLDYHFNTLAGEVITDPDRARALRAVEVTEIVNDSRKITPDCLFFCIVGAVRDGHEFARQALMDGAAALVAGQRACDHPRAGYALCHGLYSCGIL